MRGDLLIKYEFKEKVHNQAHGLVFDIGKMPTDSPDYHPTFSFRSYRVAEIWLALRS